MHAAEPELRTARLILRPLRMEDFEPWAATMADSEAARFIGGQQVRAVAWRGNGEKQCEAFNERRSHSQSRHFGPLRQQLLFHPRQAFVQPRFVPFFA